MRSIQRRVVPHLPRWMGIVSGATLVVVGLLWPLLTMPLPARATTTTTTTTTIPSVFVPEALPTATDLAMTPPMGWNGFNRFYHNVTEARVEAQARALVTTGMQAAGYQYVNLDGGWALMQRGPEDQLLPDPARFPNGIKPVADYVHSLGLKFGIYTSVGLTNCAHTMAGSYGHYVQDAEEFASWGVDYVKVDWCFIPFNQYPGMKHQQVSQLLARQMAAAIGSTGRPIVLDLNDWADHSPGTWARGLAHIWRTTHDSSDHWWSVLLNFRNNVAFYQLAGPGGWNDPDMLEIGNGGMSATEYRTQFSLWAEMAAPLIAGNDLTLMSPATRSILTNAAVIAVDQDPLGRQGYPVSSGGGHWVLVKPLASGDIALVLFNSTNTPATISAGAAQFGMQRASAYRLVDLWSGLNRTTAGLVSASVPAHGVVMYLVSAVG